MKMSVIIDSSRPMKDGRCAVKLRISQKGKYSDIPFDFSIFPVEFDGRLPRDPVYRRIAEDRMAEFRVRLLGLGSKVELMSAVQIRDWLTERRSSGSMLLPDAISTYASRCRADKTKESYIYARDKVIQFIGSEALRFEDADYKWLMAFDRFMQRAGIGTNSRSIVFRCLRAVFNDAIDNDLTDVYPFRKFKIKNEHKAKEHLSVEQFRILRDEDFGHDNDARDFFLLSFYAVGINPIDLYGLEGLPGGRIRYIRRKTSRFYDIGVQPEFADICTRFKGTNHLLNFADKYHNYDTFINFYRKKLRRVGQSICVPDITFYWARYSWATLAYEVGVSRDSISQALGHAFSGPAVTSAYIDYDYKKVDEANRRVLDYVKQ